MKYAPIVFMILILLGTSAYVHDTPASRVGDILFKNEPDMNIEILHKNVSVDFSPAGYLQKSESGSWKYGQSTWHNDHGHVIGHLLSLAIRKEKIGQFDFKYTYIEAYKLMKEGGNISTGKNPHIVNYLFINMTVVISKISRGVPVISNGMPYNFTNRSFISMNFYIQTHTLKNCSYNVSVPVIFNSPYTFPVLNFTTKDKGNHTVPQCCGFTMNINSGYPLSFLYNRTFEENGMAHSLKVITGNHQNQVIRSMLFIFHTSGTYSNITYDPYLAIPVKNISNNFTICYWKTQVIHSILTNSMYLTIGGVVGLLMIGGTYFYRKRSYRH